MMRRRGVPPPPTLQITSFLEDREIPAQTLERVRLTGKVFLANDLGGDF
jgi:hypothetical protein